jgi:hypothetical protein
MMSVMWSVGIGLFLEVSCSPEHVSFDQPFVINEINSMGNDSIELFNRTPFDFDLTGYTFYSVGEEAGNIPLPEGNVLPSNGYLVLYDSTHGMQLRGEDLIQMFSPDGIMLEEVGWNKDAAKISWCRIPNGFGEFVGCPEATFGSENIPPSDETILMTPLWMAGGREGSDVGSNFDDLQEVHVVGDKLWASDANNYRVQVFDLTGEIVETVGSAGDSTGEFTPKEQGKVGPESIGNNSKDQVFVVDRAGQKINLYDASSFEPLGEWVSDDFVDPTGLEVDADDNVFVADQGTDNIYAFDSDGEMLFSFQVLINNSMKVLSKTETLALYQSKRWLLATSENRSQVAVFNIDTGEWVEGFIGEVQSGEEMQEGRFRDDIEGIAVSEEYGVLFASDEYNGRILLFDLESEGVFSADQDFGYIGSFGRVGEAPGEFLSADGVTVDDERDLLIIADQGNHRIQAFSLSALLSALNWSR